MANLINNTNHSITSTVWLLLQDTIDVDDIKWIAGIGASVHVDQPSHTFDVMGGGTHRVAGKARIEVTTTTDKQRTMLVLKYGDRMIKLSEVFLTPYSTAQIGTTW